MLDDILKESEASEEARRKGLKYLNFGRWGTRDGTVTHVTIDGKLVPYNPAVHDKDIEFRKGAAAWHKKNGTYKKPYSGNNGYGKRKYTRKTSPTSTPTPKKPAVDPFDKPYSPPNSNQPKKPKPSPQADEKLKQSEALFFSDYNNWMPDRVRERFLYVLANRKMVKPSQFIKYIYQLPDDINWEVGDSLQNLFERAPTTQAFYRPGTRSVHLRKESAINLAKLNSFSQKDLDAYVQNKSSLYFELYPIITNFHTLLHECIHAKDPFANTTFRSGGIYMPTNYDVNVMEGLTEWKAQKLTCTIFGIDPKNKDALFENFYSREVKFIEHLESLSPGTISKLWAEQDPTNRKEICESILLEWVLKKLNEGNTPLDDDFSALLKCIHKLRDIGALGTFYVGGIFDNRFWDGTVRDKAKLMMDLIARRPR